MRLAASLTLACALVLGGGCRPHKEAGEVTPTVWHLLEAPWASGWAAGGIPEQGDVQVVEGEMHLAAGNPMTGSRFTRWTEANLPVTEYAITYEAMRVEGEDFFGTVTFPVGSHKSHASFVLGGWGGTVTGISSIDFSDANENQTRAETRFANDRWYPVRIEVRPEDLRVWVDGRLMVNVSIKGRQVGLRAGYIDHCLPFGFATYGTSARVRKVVIANL